MQIEVMSKGKPSAGVFKGSGGEVLRRPPARRAGWGRAAAAEAVWAGGREVSRGGECGWVALVFGMGAASLL